MGSKTLIWENPSVFHGREFNMTLTSWKKCSQLLQPGWDAVTEDWMIPSAVHSVTRLPMVFSGPEMPKISPPVGALDLHLTYTSSSLGPGLMQVHTPNGISIASAIFAGVQSWPTETQSGTYMWGSRNAYTIQVKIINTLLQYDNKTGCSARNRQYVSQECKQS